MSNAIKGEILLQLEDGRTLVLVGDFQSRVISEKAYGKPYRQLVEDAGEEYLGAIQALLYGMMKRHQPNITLEDVGELIESADDLLRAAEEAMEAAAPPKTEGKEGANPPRRGKTSGASGAKSG